MSFFVSLKWFFLDNFLDIPFLVIKNGIKTNVPILGLVAAVEPEIFGI